MTTPLEGNCAGKAGPSSVDVAAHALSTPFLSRFPLRDMRDGHKASTVAVIQEHWLQLCEYFQRVQCANTAEERANVTQDLPQVERNLSGILKELLTDRDMLIANHSSQRWGSPFKEVKSSGRMGASVAPRDPHQPLAASQSPQQLPSGEREVYGTAVGAKASAMRASASRSDASSCSCQLDDFDSGCAELPPCYRFLFSAVSNATHSTPTEGSECVSGRRRANLNAEALGEELAPIGGVFLLTLCQYAKQDEPPGVRSVILHFLTLLLKDADFPTDRSIYAAGEPAISLLQLNPSGLIVPLLDMVRKVSRALDPATVSRRAAVKDPSKPLKAASAMPTAAQVVVPVPGCTVDDAFYKGPFQQDAGRTQFVILLNTLAEKVECVPALANYFVVEEGSHERDLFVLLDALLLYLTHDCSTPEWAHRRDTCRFALSAVLSLAKCPDPLIQDMVGKEDRLASRTLNAARTTLLTLCKIPSNEDGMTQLLYLRDVLRFWATIISVAPSVADALRLHALIEKEFVQQSLLPLLQSSDSHVYAAACIVTSKIFADLQGAALPLRVCCAEALLSTTVRKASGRIVPGKKFYAMMVQGSDVGAAAARAFSRREVEEKAAAEQREHPMTSFFAYYILPHLSSNPCFSVHDKENSSALGFVTTRWTATKATLLLIQALAESVPDIFLREVFLMDLSSLADWRPLHKGPAPSDGEDALLHGRGGKSQESRDGFASEPPLLNIHECFLSGLHAAVLANPKIGLQADRVGEAVLSRLLRVEANMPLPLLLARQRGMTVRAQADALPPLTSVDVPQELQSDTTQAVSHHCWFHAGVQTSPLVATLCEMLRHLESTPYTVSSLVADLLVSLCVLPDLRVVYTLLEANCGPLVVALCGLRDVLRHHLYDRSAPSVPVKRSKSFVRAASTSATLDSGATLPPVYDVLLQNWDMLVEMEEGGEDNPGVAAARRGSCASEASSDTLHSITEQHRNLLYACIYFEYLHVYLDAVIGYTALSQNLMYLKLTG